MTFFSLNLYLFFLYFTLASHFKFKPDNDTSILNFPFDSNVIRLLAISEGEINLFEDEYDLNFEIELQKENGNFQVISQNFSKVLIHNQIILRRNITLGIRNIELDLGLLNMAFLLIFDNSTLNLLVKYKLLLYNL